MRYFSRLCCIGTIISHCRDSMIVLTHMVFDIGGQEWRGWVFDLLVAERAAVLVENALALRSSIRCVQAEIGPNRPTRSVLSRYSFADTSCVNDPSDRSRGRKRPSVYDSAVRVDALIPVLCM